MPVVNELGFEFRGRLNTNEPNPVEVWSCPDCAALVATRDQIAHLAWHRNVLHSPAREPLF